MLTDNSHHYVLILFIFYL